MLHSNKNLDITEKVKRAKLYYLRNKIGKRATKIEERKQKERIA